MSLKNFVFKTEHSTNYDTIFYAGRGKKDNERYFIEDTIDNPENLKMKRNKEVFPIYVKTKDSYFYLGRYEIGSVRKKKQYNPNLRHNFETLGFLCKKIILYIYKFVIVKKKKYNPIFTE